MKGDVQVVLARMVSLMEEEIAAFQRLLDVLLEQRRTLVEGDRDGFLQSTRRKARILEEAQGLERKQKDVVQDLSGHLNALPEDLNLPRVIAAVEEEYAQRLSELRGTLSELLKKVRRTNETNRFLIEHALRFVDQNVRILAGLRRQEGYGGEETDRGPFLVDIEA
ncbi:MAG TPA: flagellar protein FlgN [Candidatus Latescibacteria bacterium]|nr:flagellar protein FlgN [Candidatus Latescibacterota bacterium]